MEKFDEKTKLIFQKIVVEKLYNQYTYSLNNLEFKMMTNLFKKSSIDKMGFGKRKFLENEFYEFAIEFMGVLSKLAVRQRREVFGKSLNEFFKHSSLLKSKYPLCSEIFKYHLKENYNIKRSWENICHEHSLIFARKLRKLLITEHRTRGKFFKQFIKEELKKLFETKENIPTCITDIEYFKKYIEF